MHIHIYFVSSPDFFQLTFPHFEKCLIEGEVVNKKKLHKFFDQVMEHKTNSHAFSQSWRILSQFYNLPQRNQQILPNPELVTALLFPFLSSFH